MNLFVDAFHELPIAAQGGAITIGNFDGVHRGHQAIIGQVRRLADEVHGPAIVFTFDPPPARLLRPNEAPEALTVIERRTELLTQLGIDFVVVCRTTMDLLSLEPEQFFEQIVINKLRTKAIAEGENFRFGRKRRGDIAMLRQLCRDRDVRFSLLEPQKDGGDWISSTRIRTQIELGNIADANRLLLEPYRISGWVGRGAARGRTLGFPTANLERIPVLCPPLGVYAGRVACRRGPSGDATNAVENDPTGYPVAINIGPNPTFGETATKVEAHIVGFDGDLYGYELAIELLDRMREVRRFESKEHLLAQLTMDIDQATQIAQTLTSQMP
jgi:riboflavin kinase/FMN adenylyltransferase